MVCSVVQQASPTRRHGSRFRRNAPARPARACEPQVVVDAEGAALGSDCVLVRRRASHRHRAEPVDQPPVETLTEDEARDELAALAEEIRRHDRLYYSRSRTGDFRCRLRCAAPAQCRDRSAFSRARSAATARRDGSAPRRPPGLPKSPIRGRCCRSKTPSRKPMSAASSPASAISSAGRPTRPGRRRRDRDHGRAQDRRALARPALRERPAGAGRHARRRRHRGGRDREHPYIAERARSGWPAAGWPEVIEIRGEVYMERTGFFALNEERAAAGETGLRQSAQFRRGLLAPARSVDHRAPAAQILRLCLGRGERAVRPHPCRSFGAIPRLGTDRQRALAAMPRRRRGARLLPRHRRRSRGAAL